MKKTSLIIFVLILLSFLSSCSFGGQKPDDKQQNPHEQKPVVTEKKFTDGQWTLVKSLFKAGDYLAVNYFTSLNGVKGDGITDDTAAIQATLNKAEKAGGGRVYIGRGQYRITEPLIIPDNVALVGDFISPTSKKPTDEGTVFIIADTDAMLNDSAFILGDSSSVSDFTIWYEGQTFAAMRQYPYTIKHANGKSASITNIAIINTYNGITAASLNCEALYLENIYMTAFKNGVRIEVCSDKLTMKNISVSPVYWINSPLTPKTEGFDASVTNDAIYANLTAVTLCSVADAYISDVTVDTAKIGISLRIPSHMEGSPVFSLLNFSNTFTAVSVQSLSSSGAAFTLSSFGTSNLLNTVSVDIDQNFSSHIVFNSCTFPGQPTYSVKSLGEGRLSFVNCKFIGWREAAICVSDLIFTAVNSSFNASLPPVLINENTVGLFALSSMASLPETETMPVFIFDTENEYSFGVLERNTFSFAGASATVKDSIYFASEHGASAESADNSAAIQSAINYAYKNGGGIVFLPSGQLKIKSTLTLKKGVSLRGVGSGSNPVTATILITETNAGNPSNLITLESNTEVRDLTIFYYVIPDFTAADVRCEGNALYAENQSEILIKNVNFVRPSRGIYLNGCSFVSINNIYGTAIENGVFLKDCLNISAENINFGTEYTTSEDIIKYQQQKFIAFNVYGGENISLRDLSCDNGDYAVYLDAEEVLIVPSTPVFTALGVFTKNVYSSVAVGKYPSAAVANVVSRPTVFSTNAYHLTTFSGNIGSVNLYNLLGRGTVTGGIYARSGNISVQSSVFESLGKNAVTSDGATVALIGNMFLDNSCTYHAEANSGAIFMLGNIMNPTTAFEGLEKKYVRRYVSDTASYADDGNLRGIRPE